VSAASCGFAPEPAAAPELSPEPQLPELKDPVEHKSKTPLILLLLVLACAAGGAYWWKFARIPESAPPAVNAPAPATSGAPSAQASQAASAPAPESQTAPAPAPSRDLPPLQRARELLRAGGSPEQAVELAKNMQTPEGADGAFLLFEDAANKGSGPAMLALARYYDPLDKEPGGSIVKDHEQARAWYERALRAGQIEAQAKLDALKKWMEKNG
jgi:TPR repeat protein